MKRLDFLKLYFDGEGGDAGAGASGGDGKGVEGAGAGTGTGGKAGAEGSGKKGGEDRTTPKYSEDDLDRIIEGKLAKWQKKQAAAVDEAAKLANMTAQERVEHERDKLQKELNEVKRANVIAEMGRTARGMLQADGINAPDDIVDMLVKEEADKTAANVKSFSKLLWAMVRDEVKAQLSHKKPSAGRGSGTISREDIEKEQDPYKRQQLIRDNMSLFTHK